MIWRVGLFVRGSFPLPVSAVYAVAWALGVTGLYAALTPHRHGWRPDGGTAVAALTVTVDLLLLRAADDLRDLAYDRRHNPGRPLASGAVLPRDLVALFIVGAAALLLLNSGDATAALILGAQLAYTVVLVATELKLGWPPGDAVVLSVMLSSPVQVLLNYYLYEEFLRSTGNSPDWFALMVALLVVMLAASHHEFARKFVRSPRAGERTYVQVLGARGYTALTVGFAAA